MKAIQIIQGKTIFVIIETLYGVCNSGYTTDIGELGRTLSCNALYHNPDTVLLPTIYVTDKEVRRIANAIKLN